MFNNVKRIIEKLINTFDLKYFYIHMIYFLIFFLASLAVQPANKYMLIIIGLSLLSLKLFILWAYNGESLKDIKFLKKQKEFLTLLVVIFLIFSDLNYLINDLGILNVTIYLILFSVGYFIGFEKDIIRTSNENELNK